MEDQPVTQQAEKIVETTGKIGFGLNQLNKPTPVVITWIFRTQFVLNKAALIWLASTNLVRIENLKETILFLSIFDFVVWGLGRFVGISKDEMEDK